MVASLNRRDVLKVGLFAGAAVALPLERVAIAKSTIDRIAASKLPRPFTVPFGVPPVATPVPTADATTDYYKLTMRSNQVEILPGLKTELWAYDGIPAGPTIVTTRGRPAVVRHINGLPSTHPVLGYTSTTSVHLHGSASLPEYDGYASDVTKPGEYKDYHYPNFQDARTLWYHDHGVHHTAENAYMGLAAMYILHDDLELSLPIPHGRYDVPLVVRDAMFAPSGALIYDDSNHSGLFGDVILVNGRPWPRMEVERRKYRFRVLNASISRGYRWKLSTGDEFTVIGTDGGLMQAPQRVTELRHGMAERYEIVIDFAKYPVGTRVVLQNLGVPNAVDFDTTKQAMAFDVVADPTDLSGNAIPDVLNPKASAMDLTPTPGTRTRRFEFIRVDGHWTINGKTWEDVIKSDYQYVWANPGLGDVEIWEFVNKSGGWFHPVHVHLVDYKVLDRNGKPPFAYELGPKDVVYVGENETVRVIAQFGPHQGRYMMHCHNLVHEDHDMMAQFQVGPPGSGDDPIWADVAKAMPAPAL
jgi:FtsP/CotA-like multicopper oxidase with cupredoxin domain